MRSISFRLTIWYAVVVTLTVAGSLLAGRFFMERYLIRGLDLMVDAEFEEVRGRIEATGEDPSREAIVEAIRHHAELDTALYYFQINHNHEEIIFRSANLGGHELPPSLHRSVPTTIEHPYLGLIRAKEYAIGDLDVHIAASLANVGLLFENYNRLSLYVGLVVLVLSVGLGYLLTRVALNPVRSIQASASRITASNFNERIDVPATKDEIARMAELLNEMLDRLQAAYQLVKRFTAEASHELRTPLSIIRLQAERLMRADGLSEADRIDCLQDQLDSIERLNKLVDDLLFLAKADAGVMQLNKKRVALRSFVEDFAEDARLLAEEQSVIFEVRGQLDFECSFDPVWIRHVLLNLLSNALKVSLSGNRLELEVLTDGKFLVLAMSDEGPGVPPEKLEQVFERFHRLESQNDSVGSGLGLAICKSIMARHGGSIVALNRSPHGLRVEATLPLGGGRIFAVQ
jgi:signal transduction histidine kinase